MFSELEFLSFTKTDVRGILPTVSKEDPSKLVLYAPKSITIFPGNERIVSLGYKLNLPSECIAEISDLPESVLYGLHIRASFTGGSEVGLIIMNEGVRIRHIDKGFPIGILKVARIFHFIPRFDNPRIGR